MLALANAAVEGLLICDGDLVVAVNTSFAALAGSSVAELIGVKLGICFPDEIVRARLVAQPNQPVETGLRHRDDSVIPVEMILRPIDFAGRPHQVLAICDLRARKEAKQHIHYLAHHDTRTSLSNRSYFNERLDQEIAALADGKKLAVLCLDLDRFKEVNDRLGHGAGDRVLQTIASRISAVLGDGQIMARLDGDEFAVLVPRLADPAAAGHLADDILKSLCVQGDD
jgi:PAS domain S-box-containing protein